MWPTLEAVTDFLQLEILARLLLTIVLAAVLGLERETARQAAGLRTHILVALGAACFTVASIYGFVGHGTVRDPARVAAQVVTGIGFLGAGAILRTGTNVRGLTTAASIWMAAALGMLSGSGLYVIAIGSTILTWTTLYVLKRIERRIINRQKQDRRTKRLKAAEPTSGVMPVRLEKPGQPGGAQAPTGERRPRTERPHSSRSARK